MKRDIDIQPSPWMPFVLVFVMAIAVLLTSCASIPLGQRLDIVDVSITQSYTLAKELRQNGYISDSDWPKVLDGLNQASDGLDKAFELYAKDPAAAEKELMSVEAISKELKRRLLERQREQFNKST